MIRLLRRLRCELSASHFNESLPVFCAHGPTVHTHFVTRCARCGKTTERGTGESLVSLLLGAVAIVLLFVAAFVLAPVLA